jgi:hypothetical protein
MSLSAIWSLLIAVKREGQAYKSSEVAQIFANEKR